MAAFAIMAPVDNLILPGIIANKFPKHYTLAAGQWVVAETGVTAQQVAERIGISGAAGKFVVFSTAGFFGYYDKNLWEWLTINSG
jgi:cyanate permease